MYYSSCDKMIIKNDIYHSILSSFPTVPPEAGGVLGSRNDVVCNFKYDPGIPRYDTVIYTPRIDFINRTIRFWAEQGIQFSGLAHSHPHDQGTLSGNDIEYIRKIMAEMPKSITQLFFPLVFPGEKIISFTAIQNAHGVEIKPDNIVIIK